MPAQRSSGSKTESSHRESHKGHRTRVWQVQGERLVDVTKKFPAISNLRLHTQRLAEHAIPHIITILLTISTTLLRKIEDENLGQDALSQVQEATRRITAKKLQKLLRKLPDLILLASPNRQNLSLWGRHYRELRKDKHLYVEVYEPLVEKVNDLKLIDGKLPAIWFLLFLVVDLHKVMHWLVTKIFGKICVITPRLGYDVCTRDKRFGESGYELERRVFGGIFQVVVENSSGKEFLERIERSELSVSDKAGNATPYAISDNSMALVASTLSTLTLSNQNPLQDGPIFLGCACSNLNTGSCIACRGHGQPLVLLQNQKDLQDNQSRHRVLSDVTSLNSSVQPVGLQLILKDAGDDMQGDVGSSIILHEAPRQLPDGWFRDTRDGRCVYI